MTIATKQLLTLSCTLGLAAGASANLVNAGFEDGDNPGSGGITTAASSPDDVWGPSGEDFLHTSAPAANNGSLGNLFAFYSNNGGEAVYQVSSATASTGLDYTMTIWLENGGAQADEVAGLFIGAVDPADMPVGPGTAASTLADLTAAGITILAFAEQAPAEGWAEYALSTTGGVPASVDGKQLVVGLYNTNSGAAGSNDIWFDQIAVTPEPTSLALVGLGGLALLRRRRQA